MKKITSTLLAILLFASLLVPSALGASVPDLSMPESGTRYEVTTKDGTFYTDNADDIASLLRWSYIESITNNLNISGTTANIRVSARGNSSYVGKVVISSVLQRSSNGTTWTALSPSYGGTYNTYHGTFSAMQMGSTAGPCVNTGIRSRRSQSAIAPLLRATSRPTTM